MPIDECCHISQSAVVEGEKLDSIDGSNKTVESPSVDLGKRKRTDEGDGAPASKLIPWELHLMIERALELRELVKQHKINRVAEDKNDSDSELDNDHEDELKQCERTLRFLVKSFKKIKRLPRDWKYDPATASTFECAEPEIHQKLPPPKHEKVRCCSRVYDPNEKFPKATDVPLNDDERLIWSEFLDGDKDVPGLGAVYSLTVDEVKRPLEIENPIVSQIGDFAVAAFNETVEMYVKKGDCNNIHDIEITECKYIKMESAYYFYITIEAIEERKHGVYEAKVDFMRETSSKTLSHFQLTDRKPHKPPAEEGMMKRKTHPDSWLDCVNNKYTGMRCRPKGIICRGYDYQTPWGFGLP